MDKRPLIVVSLCAVVLLVLGSLSNVVGYQTVQTSQHNLINERINQRELLFQTICDIANNKEIQRIILKSQMSRGIFPTTEMPVVTKTQVRQMYLLGMILSKVISKSKIQSMIGKYQFNNPERQKEISTVIEKNPLLKAEITQLQNSECDCENEKTVQSDYPIICASLGLIGLLLSIPAGVIIVLFYTFHDSLLLILIVPWKILFEIIATFLSFLFFDIFECWDSFNTRCA